MRLSPTRKTSLSGFPLKRAGFSYHGDSECLDGILTKHPEMEFVQLQINYLNWESEWIQSRANYEICARHGKPVIVAEAENCFALRRQIVPSPVEPSVLRHRCPMLWWYCPV